MRIIVSIAIFAGIVKTLSLRNAFFIVLLVLIVDQAIKIYIKTTMMLQEEHHILGNWFIIHFTENPGMAFGMEFGGQYGKLFLSVFRIVAVFAIGYYLYDLCRKHTPRGLIISIALIFAGALGNIIDSAFYGLIFTESSFQKAELFSSEGGYAGFLHGKVVDMFYFPIIEGHFPEWFPIWGSEEFIFFRPVFNFADASITVGVILIILFQKKFFKSRESIPPVADINSTETVASSSPSEQSQ